MARKSGNNWGMFGLAAIGLGIFYFGRMAQTLDALDFDFRGFKFTQIGFPITNAQGTLAINNPTNKKLNFKSLFLNLHYKGSIIGTVKLAEKRTLPARSETNITFPIDIRVGEVINQTVDLVLLRKLEDVQLRGTIYVNGIQYPVDYSISLT